MKQVRIISMRLFFVLLGLTNATGQVLNKVYPQEFTEYALSNPLKGFRPGAERVGNKNYPTTIVQNYIPWNVIENDSTDGVQKIIDYCNLKWKDYEKKNVKVIPRVFIQWDWNSPNGNWPSDLTPGDWSSQKFKDRIVKLIYKLGLAWDNDPRVAWVQTGLIGWWGEQEQPVGVHQDGWALRLGESYNQAFKNKKILVRNQKEWESDGFELGTYWDSYGHPYQSNVRNDIMVRNNTGRYLDQIIEGETAYTWSSPAADAAWANKYGLSPTLTMNNQTYTNNMIDAIRELHCTGLGWVASYSLDGAGGTNIETVKANASRVQNAFGYHFVIPEFSTSARADQGSPLKMSFKVINTGSAPFYEHWPLVVTLIDETTHAIVWKETISGIDVTNWLPGDNYDLNTRSYTIPAEEYTINASIQVPAGIPSGQYMIGLSILEPNSQTPGVFFAVKNFLTASQTQPLSRIGIGQDLVGDFNINPAIFGNPVTNDNRSYSLTPTGTMYNFTAANTIGGSVDLAYGNYLQNTTLTITAKSQLGYQFTGWSGDASGTQNPIKVEMNSNKNLTANFAVKPLPLNAFATNCGGTDITSVDGTFYRQDQNFSGGQLASTTAAISGTTEDTLFQTSRWGNSFSYKVNVPNGNYEVTLFFVETFFSSTGKRIFNVEMEGNVLINKLDVFALVGKNAAHHQVRNVTVIDGILNLDFKPITDNPSVCAIKVKLLSLAPTYKLNRFSTNGLITTNPAVGTNIFAANSNVILTATPLPGYIFSGWSGDLSGSINPRTIKMDANKSITAVFTPIPSYTLTTNATNGVVKRNPSKNFYLENSTVTLVAMPNYGFVFSNWSGNLLGTVNPAIITMNANKNIKANFNYVGPTLPFATNCGGASYLTVEEYYYADTNFTGGNSYSVTNPISGTTDDVLYQSERYGNTFNYTIPVPNGDYEITLKFAEIYHTSVGKRLFNTTLEGTSVLNNFDIFAEAGGAFTAIDKKFNVKVADGILNIAFASVVDNAKINAIKVVSLPQYVTPIFNTFPQYCYGEPISALPTISNNGIAGTWSPAVNNIVTTTYTFTPDIGQYATTATATITIGGVTTWNGTTWTNGNPNSSTKAIISGDYSQAINLTACSLDVTEDAIAAVPEGFNFTISGKVSVATTARLTFENNANLIQVDNAQNTGLITIKRNTNPLSRLDYTLWSSPVTNANQTIIDFSPFTSLNRFYSYNESTNYYNALSSPSTISFDLASGYLIRIPNNHPNVPTLWQGIFTGVPNNGSVTKSINYSGSSLFGYNLVGNPYPSAINSESFVNENTNEIESSLYFWRKINGSIGSSYAVYNKAGSTRTVSSDFPNGTIQMGQGFFVKAKSGANTIRFTNLMRLQNNDNQFFKSSKEVENRFWINMTNKEGIFSQLLIGYFSDGTEGVDSYDAKYINDSPVALTSVINDEEYSIQGRSKFATSDIVALQFKAEAAGEYQIALDRVEGVFANGQDIFLIDNTIGAETNLKKQSYSFYASAKVDRNRFLIKYQKTLRTQEDLFKANNLKIYRENQDIYVNSLSKIIEEIKVYDILGRELVHQKNVNSLTFILKNIKKTNQVLVIKTVLEGKIIVTTKISK